MPPYTLFSYSDDTLPSLPPRPERSHKGTFGKVLCVCGSEGMCGAAYFAAKAAYRTGAGLVRILTVRENLPVLQSLIPEALVSVYDKDSPNLGLAEDAAAWADVLVMGCGLGTTPAARSLLFHLLRHSDKPKILDADALNLLARSPALLPYVKGAVLTPHAVEMARLTGRSPEELLADPAESAYCLSVQTNAVCLLKDHRTAVSNGSSRVYLNTTGNSGMATGGSGDVLAGILGGLLAQRDNGELSTFDLTCLGVYLHGLCGDLAATRLGEYSVMAQDLIEELPHALFVSDPRRKAR